VSRSFKIELVTSGSGGPGLQSRSKGLARLAHARGATKKRAQKTEFKYLYTYVFINNIGMYIIHFIYNIHKIVFNL
jgi:hypothetical protein